MKAYSKFVISRMTQRSKLAGRRVVPPLKCWPGAWCPGLDVWVTCGVPPCPPGPAHSDSAPPY
eukprot:3323518-Pyramimonas_sp.AAC.1